MDPNSIPATATNGTDSSSVTSSLVSSCDQLEMSPGTSDADVSGPIHRMPNEMMQHILAKLALEADANKLLRLRLVSKWWKSQVEHYCRKKKCLFVDCDRNSNKYDLAFTAPVIVRSKSIDSLGAILKLFPNIDKLIISYWTITDDEIAKSRRTAGHLNSLTSLKQLQLCGDTVLALPYMAQTLTRLEYISLDGFPEDDELLEFVRHLGPHCVRVYLGKRQDIEDVQLLLNWHDLNGQWLANVTHLQLPIYYENQYVDKFVHQLGLYATSLESLDLSFSVHHFELTLSVLGDLAKLAHLNELKFEGIVLDIALLDQAVTQHRLPTLSTVLACAIYLVDCHMLVNADSFTRVLSTIFPNLVDFKLEICSDQNYTSYLSELDLYLHRLPKLAKHKIEYI